MVTKGDAAELRTSIPARAGRRWDDRAVSIESETIGRRHHARQAITLKRCDSDTQTDGGYDRYRVPRDWIYVLNSCSCTKARCSWPHCATTISSASSDTR